MKPTIDLAVETDLYLRSDIIIHPNDGFDLGLMKEVKITIVR